MIKTCMWAKVSYLPSSAASVGRHAAEVWSQRVSSPTSVVSPRAAPLTTEEKRTVAHFQNLIGGPLISLFFLSV